MRHIKLGTSLRRHHLLGGLLVLFAVPGTLFADGTGLQENLVKNGDFTSMDGWVIDDPDGAISLSNEDALGLHTGSLTYASAPGIRATVSYCVNVDESLRGKALSVGIAEKEREARPPVDWHELTRVYLHQFRQPDCVDQIDEFSSQDSIAGRGRPDWLFTLFNPRVKESTSSLAVVITFGQPRSRAERPAPVADAFVDKVYVLPLLDRRLNDRTEVLRVSQFGRDVRLTLRYREVYYPFPPRVEWQFGDGASGLGEDTAHSYGSQGLFDVTVRTDFGWQHYDNALQVDTAGVILHWGFER